MCVTAYARETSAETDVRIHLVLLGREFFSVDAMAGYRKTMSRF